MTKSKSVQIAVEALTNALGHHTAHLSELEQIQAALWLARRCTEMAEDIADEMQQATETI